MPTIRRATVADVPAMAQLINDAAEFGLMLPKSLASLYENVREFVVAEDQFPGEPASAGGGGGRARSEKRPISSGEEWGAGSDGRGSEERGARVRGSEGE